jgi:transcriptional regulator NrdR family protein
VQTQLRIIKADGTVEEYLHTKVMATINNALGEIGRADVDVAEQFAEVVTYFLYHQQNGRNITSSEVLSMIKVVLATTGYEQAALALSERHFERKLKRSRVEVVSVDIRELTDAEFLVGAEGSACRSRWDKSRIVEDLVAEHGLCRQTARMIAAMVEEKVFSMGITRVPSSLIKQLVLGDAAAVLHAQEQLQTV